MAAMGGLRAAVPNLVSCQWVHNVLARGLDNGAGVVRPVALLDATWSLPRKDGTCPAKPTQRIPTASFVDIDAIGDTDFGLAAHNLPQPHVLAKLMRTLAIDKTTHVVVYDTHGTFSSPRFWYTLKAFGFEKVSVVNGGLPAWTECGYETEPVPFQSEDPHEHVVEGGTKDATAEEAYTKKPNVQWGFDDMRAHVDSGSATLQVVDVRSRGRFEGTVPEMRAGLRSGHIPGSMNLPFTELQSSNGMMKSKEDLGEVFRQHKIDPSKPMVTTCGSGLTACIVSLAAAIINEENPEAPPAAVYDGSWTEWGARTSDDGSTKN